MTGLGVVLLLFVTFARSSCQNDDFVQIRELVSQWAPLIWISPKEEYYPSDVDTFFKNVYIANDHGKAVMLNINETVLSQINTKSLHLVTTYNLDYLVSVQNSFLNGHNPERHPVPIYVIVNPCSPNPSFHASDLTTIRNDLLSIINKNVSTNLFFTASYWTFYPYNKGKDLCFLGKVPSPTIFGTCFGRRRTIGNHVGDWEHMTLSFRGSPYPSEMFVAIHDTGGYYRYDPYHRQFRLKTERGHRRIHVQKPKLPPLVRLQEGHPVLFSAEGSHGLWPAAGENVFVTIPHLSDTCGYGSPWRTWENLEMFVLGCGKLPTWLFFKGKWGNPKARCVLFQKLGLCEYTDGPMGILRGDTEFPCTT